MVYRNIASKAFFHERGLNQDALVKPGSHRKTRKKEVLRMKKLIGLILVMTLTLMCVGAIAATKVSGNSLASTGTSLDNFDFEIKNDTIQLNEYKGEDADVFIDATYELNGKTYTTDASRFMVGLFNKVAKSVFFAEGITEIYRPVFNSCAVYKFYLPKSLTYLDPDVLSYFSSREPKPIKLYYAGTQEEFESLLRAGFQKNNKDVKDVESINVYVGLGFNSADFDFIFEATPEDYTSGEFD